MKRKEFKFTVDDINEGIVLHVVDDKGNYQKYQVKNGAKTPLNLRLEK